MGTKFLIDEAIAKDTIKKVIERDNLEVVDIMPILSAKLNIFKLEGMDLENNIAKMLKLQQTLMLDTGLSERQIIIILQKVDSFEDIRSLQELLDSKFSRCGTSITVFKEVFSITPMQELRLLVQKLCDIRRINYHSLTVKDCIKILLMYEGEFKEYFYSMQELSDSGKLMTYLRYYPEKATKQFIMDWCNSSRTDKQNYIKEIILADRYICNQDDEICDLGDINIEALDRIESLMKEAVDIQFNIENTLANMNIR